MTIAQALAEARARGVARLDAQLLLCHLLGRDRPWLIAHDGEPLTDGHAARFEALCAQRLDDTPLAYLVGRHEFHGLALEVTPDVLDPRPDTEVLVDWALEILGDQDADVADLGTGSGAIALALAAAAPRARVVATDASAPALAVAQSNAAALDLAIDAAHGSWWQPLAGRRFDLVVSNPPYIAEGDPHLPALRHEPRAALVSGADGLDAIRSIVAGARPHLRPGGWLLLEHGHDQADRVAALLQEAGFGDITHRVDLAGHRRCTGGRLP